MRQRASSPRRMQTRSNISEPAACWWGAGVQQDSSPSGTQEPNSFVLKRRGVSNSDASTLGAMHPGPNRRGGPHELRVIAGSFRHASRSSGSSKTCSEVL